MILIVVKFPVKPEHTDQWLEATADFTAETRAEPGNRFFEWSRSVDEPDTFVLVEGFADDAAEAHVGSDHFQQGLDAMRPWSRAPPTSSAAASPASRVGARWGSSRSTEPATVEEVNAASAVLDAVLDRTLVGYTRLGPSLRRRWWPADPAPGSMAGKRVLVTGATSGIGTAIAAGLAGLGAAVHVLGRNETKVADTAADLRRRVPDAEVVEEVCDVGDLDGVRHWADDVLGRVDALHALVFNAGVMPPERSETAQGHEQALAVHVLGPHLMLHLLRGVLERGRGAEVVWMSSGGMYSAGLRSTPETIEYRDGDYQGIRAYARTKRMQVVLADRWARALAGTDVRVESMHPGWAGTPGLSESLPGFERVIGPILRDADGGADTAVWLAATRPDSVPGHFWHDRAQRPTTAGWQRGEDPAAVQAFVEYVEQATDAAVATR